MTARHRGIIAARFVPLIAVFARVGVGVIGLTIPSPGYRRTEGAVGMVGASASITVQRHVANVYLKIGAHCRAEATAYAFDHGLR